MHGSGALIRLLLANDLVDEMTLVIVPVRATMNGAVSHVLTIGFLPSDERLIQATEFTLAVACAREREMAG